MEQNSSAAQKGNKAMIRIASFIVDKRMLFFLIYIIALIFCVIAQNWVVVNNDITDYLPESTETRAGLELMEDEFTTFGSAKVMIANVPFEEALELQDKVEEIEGVFSVTFTTEDADQEDFEEYYNDGSALFSIIFDYEETDDRSLETLDLVEEALSGYDIYVSTDMGDQAAEMLDEEVSKILVLVVIILLTVLLLATGSVAEIPVLCITFVVSILLNSGTNFLMGEISFISNSVSSILQLALSIDYAIILINHYKEEFGKGYDVRDAAVLSLAESIPEILSSSLTTICGLFAMVFMQFQIGGDMGMVLIKAILLSLLTVFTLMPGLIVIFSGLMEKTKHRNLIPKISAIGRYAYKTRYINSSIFLVVFVVAFYLAQQCPYVYGYETLDTFLQNDTQITEELISDTFGSENMVALIVPTGDYDTEAELIEVLEAREDVDYCQGLANTEAMDGYMLTDTLTPRQFSELLEQDYEIAELLYSIYAADQEEYGRIVGGISSYEIPLMDMLIFVYDMAQDGYVSLDDDLNDTLTTAYDAINMGRQQLEGDNYDRILVYLTVPLPEEDEGTFDTVEDLHNIAASFYEDGEVYVVGDSTSQRDLRDSFAIDNVVVTVVSMLFVLVILLFTFKSAGLPVLLILVIEGAISLNFAYPTLAQSKIFFICELIVSSIQMGANIDYAIVISSRYIEDRKSMDRQESIIDALNFAFPTMVTSGSIMICAGLSIGFMTSDACIAGIGQCLARGTAISLVLVLFVLPQLLVAGDRLIRFTTFDIERPIKSREEVGTVRINGMVSGTINGSVVGSMNAIVHGDVKAVIVSGSMERMEDAETPPLLQGDGEADGGVVPEGTAVNAEDAAEAGSGGPEDRAENAQGRSGTANAAFAAGGAAAPDDVSPEGESPEGAAAPDGAKSADGPDDGTSRTV